MLASVTVSNFRALEMARVPLEPLTALVGPNGSGKSTLLRAIDFTLGQRWPSVNALRFPQDFTNGEDDRSLEIKVRLAQPLTYLDKQKKAHEVHGFGVRCQPYKRRQGRYEAGDPNFDYTALGADGKPPFVCTHMGKGGPSFGPLTNVPAELRDQAKVLFIDHRRALSQHQPWARGSILARLLGPARRELDQIEVAPGRTHGAEFSARYQEAMDALRTPRVREIEDTISGTTRRTLGFLGSQALDGIEVRFGFSDPANPYGTLRLNYREGDLELPAEELGAGVQSAIVVGIFEAFRLLGTNVGTVLVEEPEMYLHPQAQRYLLRLLSELAENGQAQVIYSTHSPIFADVARFESLRLVRRAPGQLAEVSWVSEPSDVEFLASQRERQKLHTLDPARSELLFARRVLIVEGPGDAAAVRLYAQTLGADLDAEDLAVVPAGSKSGVPSLARLCRALAIPVVVLHDEDEDDVKLNELVAASSPPGMAFMITPSLEGALGISRNADDKPRRVVEALSGPTPAWPEPLKDAVAKLLE